MTKDEKQCPFCAETIKKSAIKCRFCHSELIKEEITPTKQIKTSKKFASKEEEEIDYLAEKIVSGTTSIVKALVGIGIVALTFYFVTGVNPINFFNNNKTTTTKKVDIVEELVSAPISTPYIDPEKLTSTFQFFSDYTDLQREKLERDLNGKVVIWELEVYDIKSTKDPKVFKIQTSDGTSKSESLGLAGIDKELDNQLGKLFQGWSDEINKSISGKKTNHSVGTWITLHTRNASDVSQLESLKTGSWIKVKGRINGTFLRAINLDPAIIYHKTEASDNGNNSKDVINQTQTSEYSEILNKKISTFDSCHFPMPFSEVRSKNLYNYIDKTGQILVHFVQGARSSDLEIFNLNSNTFTNINSTYKENNENRKLAKKDIELFNSLHEQDSYKSICMFKDELAVSDMFTCKINGSNINCNWL